MNWTNQTIVITGAYGGLGKELSIALSKLGAQLVITGRDYEKLLELKASLSNNTLLLAGNVSSEKFRNDLQELLSPIKNNGHILINNAAVSDVKFLQNQDPKLIVLMLQVNLLAPILLTQALLPWLQQSSTANIINIGSTFGAIGYPGFSGYCASKFGLRGFSQALSRELSDTNISVNYLAPRAIATKINDHTVNQLNKELKTNVDTPEILVPQIIKAIVQNNSERHFGWPEKLFAKINGIFPSMVSKSIIKDHTTIKHYLNK